MTRPPGSADGTEPSLLLAVRAYSHPDAQALIHALYEEQIDRYGYADPPEADPDHFATPHGLFLVGYDRAGVPAGCGGYRRFDATTIEIKKMYVRPDHRGQGYGRQILTGLEDAARRAGARCVILETGVHNREALTLYMRSGYRPTPAYVPERDERINRAFTKNL